MAKRQLRRPIDPLSDPLPLKCPSCGERLVYVRTDGDVGIYHCPNDGVVVHPPDGYVRVIIH